MKIKHVALSFCLALLLSACGGGDGGGSSSVDIDTTQTNTDDSDTTTSVKLVDNSSVALSMPNLTSETATNPLEEIGQ